MKKTGAKLGPHADEKQVDALLKYKPSLKDDARVASSAMQQNATFITNDVRFGKALDSMSHPNVKVDFRR